MIPCDIKPVPRTKPFFTRCKSFQVHELFAASYRYLPRTAACVFSLQGTYFTDDRKTNESEKESAGTRERRGDWFCLPFGIRGGRIRVSRALSRFSTMSSSLEDGKESTFVIAYRRNGVADGNSSRARDNRCSRPRRVPADPRSSCSRSGTGPNRLPSSTEPPRAAPASRTTDWIPISPVRLGISG